MPYTVLAGPALGFDLTRLPHGHDVATVLRAALAAGPDDLDRLAEQHPGAEARRTRTEATGLGAPALLGTVRALSRFVRQDVLDWTWLHHGATAVQDPVATDAADVLVDAALSGYLSAHLPDEVRRSMAAPFRRSGLGETASAAPVGVEGVDRLLADLLVIDAEERDLWRQAVDARRVRTNEWAPAMHRATWVLHMSQRVRLGCDAQLAGAAAFQRAGFSVRDSSHGVWNALSGALQATVAGDLLPDEDAEILLGPWRAVHERH